MHNRPTPFRLLAHCGHVTGWIVRDSMAPEMDLIMCPDCAPLFGIRSRPEIVTPMGAGADNGGIYVLIATGLSSPSKNTILQVKTSSSVPIELIKCRLSETASTTSTKVPVQLVTFGTAATSMTGGTVTKLNGGQASTTVTASYYVTSQTDGTSLTYLDSDAANFLAPWAPQDQPDDRILIAVSSNVAIYAPSPPAGTYSALLGWREVA